MGGRVSVGVLVPLGKVTAKGGCGGEGGAKLGSKGLWVLGQRLGQGRAGVEDCLSGGEASAGRGT